MESVIQENPAARKRRYLVKASISAVTIAAGLIALLVLWHPFTATPVTTDLTPKRGPADPEMVSIATRLCTHTGAPVSPLPPMVTLGEEGKIAVALFAYGPTTETCILTDDGEGWHRLTYPTAGIVPRDPYECTMGLFGYMVHKAQVDHPLPAIGFTGVRLRGFNLTAVSGEASDDVAVVQMVRDNGAVVEATVRNENFVAWWPTEPDHPLIDQTVRSIVAFGQDGTEIRSMTPIWASGGLASFHRPSHGMRRGMELEDYLRTCI